MGNQIVNHFLHVFRHEGLRELHEKFRKFRKNTRDHFGGKWSKLVSTCQVAGCRRWCAVGNKCVVHSEKLCCRLLPKPSIQHLKFDPFTRHKNEERKKMAFQNGFKVDMSQWNLNDPLKSVDPEVYGLIKDEKDRQRKGLEMIASENFTYTAILDCLGSCLHNKYSEGQPGAR